MALSLPPLGVVRFSVLRVDARLAPLDHVAAFVTALLDTSHCFSLPEAAARGSVHLVDRVIARVAADANVTDVQRDVWCARAMQAALTQDNLPILERLHEFHPAPVCLFVPVVPPLAYATPLGLAFQWCTLETIQWFADHRADRLCCAPGIENLCRGCLLQAVQCIGDRDIFRVCMWLVDIGIIHRASLSQDLSRPLQQSAQLIKWAANEGLVSRETALQFLFTTIQNDRADVALALLDIVDTPIAADRAMPFLLTASFRGMEEVAAQLIARGHCESFRSEFVFSPVTPGGKRLVQWKHQSMHEQTVLDRLTVPSRRWIRKKRVSGRLTVADMCALAASSTGNLDALQWLCRERGVRPKTRRLGVSIVDEAALLRICQWMCEEGLEFAREFMDTMAGRGFLDVVQWLHEHSPAGCTDIAMNTAASSGHLAVVQWLHENRAEGATAPAMTAAARNGHLAVVQWLHENRVEGATAPAMTAAAQNGHLEVVQWLYEHYREQVHVPMAIERAASFGELDVVAWLAQASPEHACTRCITNRVLADDIITPGIMPVNYMRKGACRIRSLGILRWNDARPAQVCRDCQVDERRRSAAMDSIATDGDLELLQYLYAVHRDVHFAKLAKTTRRVAQNGHLGVLQWIEATFREGRGDWTEVVEAAEEFGHDRMLAWVRLRQATSA